MISFTVPGLPIAQPRQRTRVMAIGGKPVAQNYTPAKHPVNAFKAAVQLAAVDAINKSAAGSVWKGQILSCPIALRLIFVFPRPKALLWKSKPMPRAWCFKKPDADNLIKSVCDALNMLVWRDDAQVVSVSVEKWIGAGDESPGVHVEIEPVGVGPSWA
jgi:Holliday junction resolvase RusA-like endonuclease